MCMPRATSPPADTRNYRQSCPSPSSSLPPWMNEQSSLPACRRNKERQRERNVHQHCFKPPHVCVQVSSAARHSYLLARLRIRHTASPHRWIREPSDLERRLKMEEKLLNRIFPIWSICMPVEGAKGRERLRVCEEPRGEKERRQIIVMRCASQIQRGKI